MPGCGTVSGRAAIDHARLASATGLLAAALLLLLLLPAPPAAGQALAPPPAPPAGAEPAATPVLGFTQQGVPAEATAENAVLARERALASGRRIAWERLVAEAGVPGGVPLSDSQIEQMVSSIVIEQERITPTRYAGRITVNFNPSRVRSILAGRAPGLPPAPPSEEPPPIAARPGASPGGPASNWLEVVATYRSMAEWLELRRRLGAAAPVASVAIQGIATDRARLRLGLRAPPPVAAEELAALGVVLQPAAMAAAAGMRPSGETWRVGLAGGG